LIVEAAIAAIQKHKSLPAGQAETFASRFKIGTASLEALPLTLPEPLVHPNVRQFPNSRKRAMTGREATEKQE
jgi:hypothetical protein